jgi:hypothetical protein
MEQTTNIWMLHLNGVPHTAPDQKMNNLMDSDRFGYRAWSRTHELLVKNDYAVRTQGLR